MTPIFKKATNRKLWTNNCLKCLKKTLKKDNYLTKYNLLSKKQFGFKEHTSIILHIFINLTKAFETIGHKRILEKIRNYRIRGI